MNSLKQFIPNSAYSYLSYSDKARRDATPKPKVTLKKNKNKRKKISSVNASKINKVIKSKEREYMNKFNIRIKSSDYNCKPQKIDTDKVSRKQLSPIKQAPEVSSKLSQGC